MTTHVSPPLPADAVLPGDASAPPALLMSSSQNVLPRIREPETDLTIWQRTLPDDLVRWISELPAHLLPNGRVLARLRDMDSALGSIFHACGTPGGAMRTALKSDIMRLARIFARIADVPLVDLRIEAIDDDACKKFHRDSVPFRLLVTYRGPSTQWVLPCDAERAIASQRDFDGPIKEIPIGSVALFRGALGAANRGVVHRSPPIAGTGITRLFLCLNVPSAASPDPWNGA